MSLLLEALKKAEQAKQEQSGKAVSHQGFGEYASGEPGLERSGTARLPAKAAEKEPSELSLVDHFPPEPKLPPPEPSRSAGAQQAAERAFAERQAAAGVFAAKKPTRKAIPVWAIAVAAAAVIAAGGGFYVWKETSRPGIAINSGGTAITPGPAAPASAPMVASGNQAQPSAPLPAASSEPQQVKPTEPESPPEREAAGRTPKVTAPVKSATAAPDAGSPIKIQRTQPLAAAVNPTLASAYQAFMAGDIGTAQQNYRRVLQTEPNSRDALLGLAAIELKQGQEVEAERYYLRVLELDPRDPVANAGMINLKKQLDPALSESRLKMLLAQQPEAGHLHFALGNLYASQSRWAEAQQAYFKAFSSEPIYADFAFNLAVSLDYLNQRKLALDYYRRALSLAANGPANFDKAQASSRIRELEQQR